MKEIKFAIQDIQNDDIDAVSSVLRSGWLTHGKYTKLLEDKFCEFTNANHSITVSNCTAGLHLSCMSQGIKNGDEVIVPAMTHTATAHAVEFTGAKAVFADIDPKTGNILPSDIRKKITKNTKGVIVVHMTGYPCDMDEIIKICKENNIFLIEDCAHAIGTTYKGKHVGNFGIAGNFSFYPTKQITTGEGGMVICNDDKISHFIHTHKAFGIDTPPEKRNMPGVYDVQGLGYNYRMTDFQSALGYSQMMRYDWNLSTRKKNAKMYYELFGKLSEHIKLTPFSEDNSFFLFQIFVDSLEIRNELVKYLKENNIGCSIHYATPVPMMSYYASKYGYKDSDFPNAKQYADRNISLPIHPFLTNEDIKSIFSAIKFFLEK